MWNLLSLSSHIHGPSHHYNGYAILVLALTILVPSLDLMVVQKHCLPASLLPAKPDHPDRWLLTNNHTSLRPLSDYITNDRIKGTRNLVLIFIWAHCLRDWWTSMSQSHIYAGPSFHQYNGYALGTLPLTILCARSTWWWPGSYRLACFTAFVPNQIILTVDFWPGWTQYFLEAIWAITLRTTASVVPEISFSINTEHTAWRDWMNPPSPSQLHYAGPSHQYNGHVILVLAWLFWCSLDLMVAR